MDKLIESPPADNRIFLNGKQLAPILEGPLRLYLKLLGKNTIAKATQQAIGSIYGIRGYEVESRPDRF